VVTPSITVWDLETVPDLAGVVAANDLVGKSDGEIREA
jgi:predicted PolB exonuclease-like 3'-5' exonuclease